MCIEVIVYNVIVFFETQCTYIQTYTRHPDYLSRASQHARGTTKNFWLYFTYLPRSPMDRFPSAVEVVTNFFAIG